MMQQIAQSFIDDLLEYQDLIPPLSQDSSTWTTLNRAAFEQANVDTRSALIAFNNYNPKTDGPIINVRTFLESIKKCEDKIKVTGCISSKTNLRILYVEVKKYSSW
jgi:hypothetical protein